MLPPHSVYVVSLVSQATSASILALLAWLDRRSRWLVPLAAACGLHAGAIYLMPLWRGSGLWLPHAVSAANLVVMLYLFHVGLQCLAVPQRHRSTRTEAGLLALMLVLGALARYSSIACTEATTISAAGMLAWTVGMLWKASARDLRRPLRATALLLCVVMTTFLVRVPLEIFAPASRLLLLLREATMLLITLLAFSFLALYVAETRRRLHEESRMDVLTGLLNRRAMEEAAAATLKLAVRNTTPSVLLVMDLDDFKKLNDTWGHDVGDRALCEVGQLLSSVARELADCPVARMGGEEFAMLLKTGTLRAAYEAALSLCQSISALRLAVGESEIRLTASIGVSALGPGEVTWTEMLRRADTAMYRAKRSGRNRVTLSPELRHLIDHEKADQNILIRQF